MAGNATININAVDNTRAAFLNVQRNLGGIAKTGGEVTKKIARLGVGMLGLGSAMSIAQSEIRNLVRNIEQVPDVNDRAAASVLHLREQLSMTFSGGGALSKGITGLIDGFVIFGQTLGMVAGQVDAFFRGQALSIDELKALFAEMRKEQEDSLRVAQVKAMEDRFKSLNEQLDKTRALAGQAMAPLEGSTLKGRDRIRFVEEAISKERILIQSLGESYAQNAEKLKLANRLTKQEFDSLNLSQEQNLKQQNDSYNEVIKNARLLNQLKKEEGRISKEAGKILASGFEDAIFSGKKLSDVIKQLGQDILRLMFRNMITERLGNFFSAGLSSIFGFADGGLPPTGRASIVGERGPELFVPGTSGRIVPNHELGGGSGSSQTYYIDARGADQTGLARLEGMIRETRASIRPIALASVMDTRARGGAMGRAA